MGSDNYVCQPIHSSPHSLDICIDLQDIPLRVFEEECPVSVVLVMRRFEDFHLLFQKLAITGIDFFGHHTKGKLNTCGPGNFAAIIRTPA